MRKSASFQIAGKLRGILTDNSFKRVQITYLCVISNLDKLVQPSYTLSKSDRWQALELAKQCTEAVTCGWILRKHGTNLKYSCRTEVSILNLGELAYAMR